MVAVPAAQKPPRIQALARASAIIDVIAASGEDGEGLGEICRVTALNKTTAFNLVSSLVSIKLIEQDKVTKRYRLGLRNLELGRLVQQRLEISHLARPILAVLCNKTNETINLGLPDLIDYLVIDSYQGAQRPLAVAGCYTRSLYHCTALGKAFMTEWDEPMRHTIYRLKGLPKRTPKTITDPDGLERHLAQCREQGYALDVGENEIGVNGVAKAIINGMGDVAAAISVAGHSDRLTLDVMRQIAPDVVAAANAISAALSGVEALDSRKAVKRK